jgi:tetratricopeptide (TPR) repeat protein
MGREPSVADAPDLNPSLVDRMLGKTPEVQYQQPIQEVPSKLKNPSQLSLVYAQYMEKSGNLEEAQTHYGRVLEEKPESVDAIVGLARVHQLSGRSDEAEQAFHKALRIDPQSPAALHGMGQFYASKSRWHEAAELLNKAVAAAPGERSVRYDLAVALVHTDNVDAALPHFIRTVGDAEAHYNIGLILHQEGRRAESAEHFRLALAKKPDLQQAKYWLDMVRREETGGRESRPALTSAPRTSAPATPAPAQGSLSLAMHP